MKCPRPINTGLRWYDKTKLTGLSIYWKWKVPKGCPVALVVTGFEHPNIPTSTGKIVQETPVFAVKTILACTRSTLRISSRNYYLEYQKPNPVKRADAIDDL